MSLDASIILHGRLCVYQASLEASLGHVSSDVCVTGVTYGLGLKFLGQKRGGAAWAMGNCLMVVRWVDSNRCEARLISYSGAPADRLACDAWLLLANTWAERHWLPMPVPNPVRAPGVYCPERFISRYDLPEIEKPAMQLLAAMTAQQAAAAYFTYLQALSRETEW